MYYGKKKMTNSDRKEDYREIGNELHEDLLLILLFLNFTTASRLLHAIAYLIAGIHRTLHQSTIGNTWVNVPVC